MALLAPALMVALASASPVSTTTAHAPAAAPAAEAPTLRLQRGVELLDRGEYEAARGELELALQGGPYDHAQVVQLYRALGLVRAFLDDAAGAEQAFVELLTVAPGFSLPYTVSPKATFVFDHARQRLRGQRDLEVAVETDPVIGFDREITVRLRRVADPGGRLRRLTLLHRLKGEAEYRRLELAAPPPGQVAVLPLPAIPGSAAVADPDGEARALLQLAVLGFDARGWEIYRDPPPERPQGVPVGFDPPGPWYTRWWLWGLAGGSVAAQASGALVAALLWPAPERVPVRYQVLP